jgi:hypothetical protein
MFVPLRSNLRRRLLRAALCALGAAIALAPLAIPCALPAAVGAGFPVRPVALPAIGGTAEPEVTIARDPFVPDAPVDAAGTAPADGSAIAVEAVALGSSPHALVRVGGATRIVGVGDALAGSTVNGIDAHGVALESGETLPFSVQR